jgi:DNA-binding response OmpR family regulator
MRILLVEDEYVLRDVLETELLDAGFDVCAVGTGDDAKLEILNSKFDLLVTDIQLPGSINGLELAHFCQRIRPGTPVVYVSALSDIAREGVRGSVVVRMPFRPSKLIQPIRTLAERGMVNGSILNAEESLFRRATGGNSSNWMILVALITQAV